MPPTRIACNLKREQNTKTHVVAFDASVGPGGDESVADVAKPVRDEQKIKLHLILSQTVSHHANDRLSQKLLRFMCVLALSYLTEWSTKKPHIFYFRRLSCSGAFGQPALYNSTSTLKFIKTSSSQRQV